MPSFLRTGNSLYCLCSHSDIFFIRDCVFLLYPSDFLYALSVVLCYVSCTKISDNNLYQMNCFHFSTACPLPPCCDKLFIVISIAVYDTIKVYSRGCSGNRVYLFLAVLLTLALIFFFQPEGTQGYLPAPHFRLSNFIPFNNINFL